MAGRPPDPGSANPFPFAKEAHEHPGTSVELLVVSVSSFGCLLRNSLIWRMVPAGRIELPIRFYPFYSCETPMIQHFTDANVTVDSLS